MTKKITTIIAIFLTTITISTSAFASNYELTDLDLIPEKITSELKEKQITTSFQLLDQLLSKTQRTDFAKNYNLVEDEVELLAKKLELMQIDGIGPKAATLLIHAKISTLKQLSQASPATLLETLITVNTEKQITGVQPDLPIVKDWIDKAQNKDLKQLK